MNKKASELGLTNTHFVTPHGLDAGEHYTTAYELALLTDYALKNKTFCNIVGTKSYTITINGYSKKISNTNELLGYLNGVYGVKTGFTNGANRCLVTAAKRENLDVICVVLGADTKKDRTKDSITLIEYAFNNFKISNISEQINSELNKWILSNKNKIHIEKGNYDVINLKYDEYNLNDYVVKKDDTERIQVTIISDYDFVAPVSKNTVIGNYKITLGENILACGNLYIENEIPRKNVNFYFKEFLKLWKFPVMPTGDGLSWHRLCVPEKSVPIGREVRPLLA